MRGQGPCMGMPWGYRHGQSLVSPDVNQVPAPAQSLYCAWVTYDGSNFNNTSLVKFQPNIILLDPLGLYNSSNGRFTAAIDGTWLLRLDAGAVYGSLGDPTLLLIDLNGSNYLGYNPYFSGGGGTNDSSARDYAGGEFVVPMLAGDYLEMYSGRYSGVTTFGRPVTAGGTGTYIYQMRFQWLGA